MDLLVNQTTNGSTATPIRWRGVGGTIVCRGTFNGATVTVEANDDPDDPLWLPLPDDAIFTSAGLTNFRLGDGFELRATVSSAGGSTDVTCRIRIFRDLVW